MSEPRVTVVVPTLTAGAKLTDCLRSLKRQRRADFEVIVVDNSGLGEFVKTEAASLADHVIENSENLGFGAAINQGFQHCPAPYLATLNDDAVADAGWLEALVAVMDANPGAGMGASRVMRAGTGRLDSAGMLICRDGTSKQRGQGELPEVYREAVETLFPSGSAAIYRRRMLEEIGLFDEEFFLYCEDTDLGLRARRAGWECLYVPDAVVEHHYSRSAGPASPLKAYLVERNRLFVIAKNFPFGMLLVVPWFAMARYLWHALTVIRGHGAAAEFRNQGHNPLRLVWYVIRGHFALLAALPRIIRLRAAIARGARLSAGEFRRLLARHSISPRQVAAL